MLAAGTRAGTNWELVGIMLTAAGAIATAVISWFLLQHGRQVTGHRRPVVAKKPLPVGLGPLHRPSWIDQNGTKVRVAMVHLFNRSGQTQHLWINVDKSRVLWPLLARRARFQHAEITIAGGEGGNYALLLLSDVWPPDDEPIDQQTTIGGERFTLPVFYRKRYWIRFVSMTKGGNKVRYTGRVQLAYYPSVRTILDVTEGTTR